ncbi:hypothetical protein [Leptothoe spongobia]|uniref:Uncharacterized protein n=1 Tax=Leptothoe spongobia TAU-MAC 1115 TaxID=1967444 RepID=A0A947DHW4_9CYAN|nr:hypothetical protein [Leptothoe spongobia]MBT9317222.1 hypothetical protein [Leptothoe spongobia TAU-MAC 1115]
MIDAPWRKRLRWLVIAALIVIPGGFLTFVGWLRWTIHATYTDYEQVKACLERHQFEVIEGWQHQDMILEDFGWRFRTASGQQLGIDVYDGNQPRDCRDRAAGVQLLEKNLQPGRYLSFDHPGLIDALDGQRLRTMDDMLENLDELLAWAEENPQFKVDPTEVTNNSDHYLNLIIVP